MVGNNRNSSADVRDVCCNRQSLLQPHYLPLHAGEPLGSAVASIAPALGDPPHTERATRQLFLPQWLTGRPYSVSLTARPKETVWKVQIIVSNHHLSSNSLHHHYVQQTSLRTTPLLWWAIDPTSEHVFLAVVQVTHDPV